MRTRVLRGGDEDRPGTGKKPDECDWAEEPRAPAPETERLFDQRQKEAQRMSNDTKRHAMRAIARVFRHETAMKHAIETLPDPLRETVNLETIEARLDEETHALSNAYERLERELSAEAGRPAMRLHRARIGTAGSRCHAIVIDDEKANDLGRCGRAMEGIATLASESGEPLGGEDNAVVIVADEDVPPEAVTVAAAAITGGSFTDQAAVLISGTTGDMAHCVFGGRACSPGEAHRFELLEAVRTA